MTFLHRCFQLAQRGSGFVTPNPLVGAVLVHDGEIIGEGWHKKHGESHAEVNAFQSVAPENQDRIPDSTLYCNLEPCFHTGKTPPCVDRILKEKVKKVVISNLDPNPLVAGQSMEKLRSEGVEVEFPALEQEGAWLNRFFFKAMKSGLPWVTLKWAESADGFISKKGKQTPISNPLTKRMVHRWRSEAGAILVGPNTAVTDNPSLNNRYFPTRPNPLRVLLDFDLRTPDSHALLDGNAPTLLVSSLIPASLPQNTRFLQIESGNWIEPLLQWLHSNGINHLLVEGGASIHRQFIDANHCDEILLIRNQSLILGDGVPAAKFPLKSFRMRDSFHLGDDEHVDYMNT